MRSERVSVSPPHTHPHPDHVTPYDRFAWSDTAVEQLLASGEQQRELIAYFGEAEYRALVPLAQEAARANVPEDAPRVLIVPGIMGSQLGLLRSAPLPNDVLWIDPVDISIGNLALLKLPDGGKIVPLGVVLFTYLRLKLQLRIAGFAPVFHDYDWRLGVDELGLALAERVRAENRRVMIVAHSMGGLVTRAAMACEGMQKVERVVLLGTPNSGSYAPLQALRGVYAVVRKIARLASVDQSAESLAAEVFSTFPSLYHLLPPPGFDSALDLFDADAWPNSGPRPDAALLTRARSLATCLAIPDERFINVVGAGQETVTRVSRRKDGFVYTITRQGDGTVPLTCAALPGARTYYTRVAHTELARDPAVAQAIAEALRTGETKLLTTKWSRNGSAEARISDSELRRTHVAKVDWVHMDPDARQHFLRNLNDPPQLKLRAPRAAAAKRNTAAQKPAASRTSTRKSRSSSAAAAPKRKHAASRAQSASANRTAASSASTAKRRAPARKPRSSSAAASANRKQAASRARPANRRKPASKSARRRR
jgi:pimeloyl-ACP methyl ester carboxylesterase